MAEERNNDERKKVSVLERVVFGFGATLGVMDALLMRPDVPLLRYFINGLPFVIPAFAFTYVITKDMKITAKTAGLIYGGHLVGEAATMLLRQYT